MNVDYLGRCPVAGCSFHAEPSGGTVDLWEHLTGFHKVDGDRVDAYFDERTRAEQTSRLELDAGRIARDWTLDTFPSDDAVGLDALTLARVFVAGELGARLYVDGPPGTGKTGLAVGIAKAWIAGNEDASGAVFANVRRLLAEQRQRFSAGLGADLERFLAVPPFAPLVVLDDLGAERPTEYALDVVALLVESLHANGTPLVVTTNYTPARLAARLGYDDPATGQRIVSRLIDGATRIRLDRADLRRPLSPLDEPLELGRPDDEPPLRALRMVKP